MGKPSGKQTVTAVGVGSGIGAALGSGIGIAGAFGAISGVLPVAALGGYLGYKVVKALSGSKILEEVSQSSKEAYAAKSAEIEARRMAILASRPLVVTRRKLKVADTAKLESTSQVDTPDVRKAKK